MYRRTLCSPTKISLFFSILTFMSNLSFMHTWVEHAQSYLTSIPGLEVLKLFMLNSTKHEIYTAHEN